MSALADLHKEYSDLTYWEIEEKFLRGEIGINEKIVLQTATPDYMAMAEDIEITEVQYVR